MFLNKSVCVYVNPNSYPLYFVVIVQ